ncbi:MAG: hypothetical protein ABIH08_05980 [Candidatus Omnitrophota bacterium]
MNREIKQSIAINADYLKIFEELLFWGQSQWWPKNSLMRFENLTKDIREKTLYLQKIKLPFGPKWHSVNETIDRNKLYIKRVFLDGLFEGCEELSVLKGKGTPEVVYCFNYKVKGFFNKLIWKILFKKLHIKNINLVLQSLKNYLEN